MTLRLGRWEDVLADVDAVSAVICDPPYSARVHEGHDAGVNFARNGVNFARNGVNFARRELSYVAWAPSDVDDFVDSWAPRNRGWFVCMSDNELCPAYRAAYERHGLTAFAPVGILIPGMTVRMAGDGPSSWMLYANVARPKALSKWGTLPGGYTGGSGERIHVGGKPLWLMRKLVKDYSRRGDLVCDPCAGAATTLLAALCEGRRTIGAEVDPETHRIGVERLSQPYTVTLDFGDAPKPEQTTLALGGDES